MTPTIIIRMGAAKWDVKINNKGNWLTFDLRKMERRQRSDFHREFMNAFRAAKH